MKLKEIQEDLDQMSKIRFNKTFEKTFKPKSFEEVIDRAIGKVTNYVRTGESTIRETGGYQCPQGRMRGAADLYRLTTYYFPKTKLEDIIKYIRSKNSIGASQCSTTNQTVFWPTSNGGRKSDISIRLKNRKKIKISE